MVFHLVLFGEGWRPQVQVLCMMIVRMSVVGYETGLSVSSVSHPYSTHVVVTVRHIVS